MDQVSDSTEFELPLELQFSMAKAEVQAKDLTWDQLYLCFDESIPPASNGESCSPNPAGRRTY